MPFLGQENLGFEVLRHKIPHNSCKDGHIILKFGENIFQQTAIVWWLQIWKVKSHVINIWTPIYTVSQKKFPPLNSLQLSQILTDFQNFYTAGKPMKFATKSYDIFWDTVSL